MKRHIGAQIAAENLEVGKQYIVRTYTLGGAVITLLEDLGTHGWKVEVVQGVLQSPANRQKRWGPKQQVTLPVDAVEKWYEPAEIG